jgi:hypothetical protein
MFCPQCGTESSSNLKYCRSCGANLKVIGKAVTLSEAIARSDGVPAKIKELVSNIKIAHVTEEVSRALDKMNKELVRSSNEPTRRRPSWLHAKTKTPEQRRERHLTKGTIKLFWGGGLTIFLYFLANALVLKLPPDVIASIPFEIDPVVHVLWLLGLIPMLSGVGHILAGLTIKPTPTNQIEFPEESPIRIDQQIDQEALTNVRYPGELTVTTPREAPASITDRTTNILEHKVPVRQANEIKK